MQALMGFGGFGTTKVSRSARGGLLEACVLDADRQGAEVEGNDVGTVKVNKKRQWRQYMNRRGGFNRALD